MRESISAVTAARQLGYKGDFIGSQTTYLGDTARLGGSVMEGVYAIGEYPMMYRDDPKNSPALNQWMDAYSKRFSADPDVYSATGWILMDVFATALKAAGAEPTADTLVAALERVKYARTFLGNPEYSFGPTRHQGGAEVRVNQIQKGRWAPVTDYLEVR
jgi:ABC-type branched-subunit amino acid transport system substrate-binding protein